MSKLLRDFVDHPHSVGESYVQHWHTAMGFSLTLLALALACAVHAFVPGLFKQTASRCIDKLHRRMITQRHRGAATGTAAASRG